MTQDPPVAQVGVAGHLTLEQIGRRAGVSRSTVSRVLNDRPDVRPDVRARVEAVIRETGYEPNAAARALVSKRSGLIGLVMLTEVDELFGDPYHAALVNGIQQGCAEHDLIFAIFPAFSPDGHSDALTPQITQRFVDGVIVTSVPGSDHVIDVLRARGKRTVIVGNPRDGSGLQRVDVDNREGSAGAVAHLIEHGRRRIGFVGATAEYPFGGDRLDGYHDALGAAGLTPEESLVQLDRPTAEGGFRAAAVLLAARPDAIFAATDTIAAGVYRAVAEGGRRIPDDIAVAGFDGLPRGPRLEPELTTVVQPVLDVARTAVGLLADDDAEPQSIVLLTALRLGASCGSDHC